MARFKAAVLELEIRECGPRPAPAVSQSDAGDLGERIRAFATSLCRNWNLGQLRMILRTKYLVDAKGIK